MTRTLVARVLHTSSGSRLSAVLAVIAAVLLIVSLVALVARYHRPGAAWSVGVAAFAPHLMLAAPAALVLFGAARHWIGFSVAAGVTLLCLLTQITLFVSTDPPADARRVIVMTANLYLGGADPHAVVAAVRRHHVDVLMLEELTAGEQARLIAAGLEEALPFSVSDPRDTAAGTGLWSRYPMTATARRTDFTFGLVSATVHVPQVPTPPCFVATHMAGPWPFASDWQRDIRHLVAVLPSFGHNGATVVGGDFNATPDHVQFRALLRDGYADAGDQAGAGLTATYPADRWYPPLIAIDHVLTRHAVATKAGTVSIARTDHRALVVEVAVPRR